MCDEIKITKVADDKIEVRTPYNPQFVSKIKTAGARWNAIDKWRAKSCARCMAATICPRRTKSWCACASPRCKTSAQTAGR